MKTCTKCHVPQQLSDFYVCRSFKDGLNLWCKSCCKNYYETRGRKLRGSVTQEQRTAQRRAKAIGPTKKCIKCQQEKPRDEFHKNRATVSGLSNICKTCRPAHDKVSYLRNRKNPEWLAKRREWAAESMRRARKRPETMMKHYARQMTGAAVKAGILLKQACEQCGAKDTRAHHDDYSKPLEVRWLCHPCHTAFHVEERRKH